MLQNDTEQNNCTETFNELKSYPPVPPYFSTETIQNSLKAYLLSIPPGYDITESVGTFEIIQKDNRPQIDGYVLSLGIDDETKKFTKIRYCTPIIRLSKIEWGVFTLFGPCLDKINCFYNENIEFFTPEAPNPELYVHRILLHSLPNASIDETISNVSTLFSKFLIPFVELNDMSKPPSKSKTYLAVEILLPKGWTFTRTNTIDTCVVEYFDNDGDKIFKIVVDWYSCYSSINFEHELFETKYKNIVMEDSRSFLDLRDSNLRILNDIKNNLNRAI